MQKHLQLVGASALLGTMLLLFAPCRLRAENSSSSSLSITASTDDSGRTIYVNDFVAARAVKGSPASRARRSSLVFWSVTEHRWKPVPAANVRAARSAADEVDQYLGEGTHAGPGYPTRVGVPVSVSPQDIDAAIDAAALRHNVDPALVRAVIKVESNFNPNAVSRKGALGLMQLMPQTARQLKVSNPFDPQQNVDAGVRHLKQLMESYGGDVNLTLAAYNAGAGAVARSSGVPHYAETEDYVRRITQLVRGGTLAGSPAGSSHSALFSAPREPLRMHRDERGVLNISNTD
jgi:soluble lytic murein transglycosylase-like protein